MSTPPTGWYPDPAGSEGYRWWNGTDWTDALSATADADPPVHADPAGPGRTSEVETLDLGRRRSLARPVAVLVVVALVAVTALGVGAALFGPGSTRTSTGGSTVAPPTTSGSAPSGGAPSVGSASVPPGYVDERTGATRIGDAVMTLPPAPYVIGDAMALDPYFDAVFAANAPVHPATTATTGWYSTVALLHAPADRVDGDPEETSVQAMQVMTKWLFGAETTVRLKNERQSYATVGGQPALRLQAEAHYAIDGLASTHDDVTVLALVMPDGSLVAALSSVPDDAPQEHRTLAAASLATLSVR